MPNFIIRTHQKNTIYKGIKIFILNKGMNSGKPQKEPFSNSLVIQFSNEEDAETIYWLAYSLWKAKFWHPSLKGSVIPFLTIQDFKKDFSRKVNEMLQEHELHQKQVQALRLLEQKEEHLHQNILLINEMRRAILRYYLK
ncbi:DUF6943 family protein [Flavobacterium sp.]|uniref:DUF6943 family protein n=1 Tax=Flavobacterium sp. TaxID=239 RepID=UPI002B4AEB4D|nr:hypothetical protein [Flavobacterium sp.]HLF52907.1 hypothetical protein [Flavobacterium sp.]